MLRCPNAAALRDTLPKDHLETWRKFSTIAANGTG